MVEIPSRFKLRSWEKPLLEAGIDNIGLWAKGYFGLDVFPWQQYFYRYPVKDKMAIAGIRVGKSFMVALGALHFCHYHPQSGFLNTSLTSEQAKIVYYTCVDLCQRDAFRHWVSRIDRSPYPRIELINGSYLDFRSVGYEAEALRGFEWDFISIDECAYITNPQVLMTLQGRLMGVNKYTGQPREGWLWQLSSPKGKGSWVYDRWKLGDTYFRETAQPEKYLSLRVRTTDNPLLSREQIADIMAKYSEHMIAQELEGAFLDSEFVEFPYDLIMQGCAESHDEVRVLNRLIEQWRSRQQRKHLVLGVELEARQLDLTHYELDARAGRNYLASWDLGKKANEAGRNATVGMVWDITETPWCLIAYRYEENQSYLRAVDWIEEWDHKYNGNGARCYTVIDATGKGDVVNEVLRQERGLDVDGLEFTGSNKPDMIAAGKMALEKGLVRYPFIRKFVDQMATYERFDKDLAQDTVMTFCMAMYRIFERVGMRVTMDRTRQPQGPRVSYRRTPLLTPDAWRYRVKRKLAHR